MGVTDAQHCGVRRPRRESTPPLKDSFRSRKNRVRLCDEGPNPVLLRRSEVPTKNFSAAIDRSVYMRQNADM